MLAVILAGGKGRRLMPYTAEIPKPLVKLDDRSVLEHLLERMAASGVKDIRLAVNHQASMIKDVIGDGSRFNVTVSYVEEAVPLSTAGPLLLVDDLPDCFLVVNGDILTDIDFGKVFDTHKNQKAPVTIVTQQRKGRMEYGVLESDAENRITSFTEKPAYDYTVSCGIYVFNREILQYIPSDRPFGFDQLMIRLLKENVLLNSYPFSGYWLDIGRIEDYEQARLDLARLKRKD